MDKKPNSGHRPPPPARCVVRVPLVEMTEDGVILRASLTARKELKGLVRATDPRYTVLASGVQFVEASVEGDQAYLLFRGVPSRVPSARRKPRHR